MFRGGFRASPNYRASQMLASLAGRGQQPCLVDSTPIADRGQQPCVVDSTPVAGRGQQPCLVDSTPVAAITRHQPPSDEQNKIDEPPDPQSSKG